MLVVEFEDKTEASTFLESMRKKVCPSVPSFLLVSTDRLVGGAD